MCGKKKDKKITMLYVWKKERQKKSQCCMYGKKKKERVSELYRVSRLIKPQTFALLFEYF